MGNISYFCIVKRFTTHLKYLLVLVAVLLATQQTNAQVDSVLLKSMDSVKISLLTCGPGDQIYSYYGHTAIHYNDVGRQQDIVVNYGMFPSRKATSSYALYSGSPIMKWAFKTSMTSLPHTLAEVVG